MTTTGFNLARLAAACALSAAGCAEVAKPVIRSVDSAGVTIVVNDQPAWKPGEEWRIDDLPLVDPNGPGDSTDIIEVAGVVLLADGGFVAGDHADNSIRFHDASGRLVSKAGRKGEGPGEFSSLTRIGASGDSILVWDRSQMRITTYDGNGRAGATQRVTFVGVHTAPALEGRWADGRWLFVEGLQVSSRQPTGPFRGTMAAIRLDSSGRDTVLGRWPGGEQMAVTSSRIVAQLELPYARATTIRMDDAGFWVGTADEPRLDRFDKDGWLTRSIRWRATPVPVPRSELEAWRRRALESFSTDRSPFAAPFVDAYGKALFPATRPAYRTFLTDGAGGLWVQRVSRWDEQERPGVWDVFDAQGQWLGAVTMPARATPRDIRGDRVVGVWKDADDVERVRVYRIRRE